MCFRAIGNQEIFSLEKSGRRRVFPIEGFASRGSRPFSGVSALKPSIPGGSSAQRPWSASPASRSTPDLSYGGALRSRAVGSSSPYGTVLRPSFSASRPASAPNGPDDPSKPTRVALTARERLQALLADRPTSSERGSVSSRPTSGISVGGLRTIGGPTTASRPISSSSKSIDYRPGIRTT